MKLKKLKRKIEQLEKRLREGPQKLAKLRRRLQEAEAAKALKAARKSAARATSNRKSGKPSALVGQKSAMPSGDGNQGNVARMPKKKVSLSPERRAQISAAMRARWAAKKADEGNSSISTGQNSAEASTSQPPENRTDGI